MDNYFNHFAQSGSVVRSSLFIDQIYNIQLPEYSLGLQSKLTSYKYVCSSLLDSMGL